MGNALKNFESNIRGRSMDELEQMAIQSIGDMYECVSEQENSDSVLVMMMFQAARIGICGDNNINDEEREFVARVIGKFYNGSTDEILQLIGEEISEKDYLTLNLFSQLGQDFSIAVLRLILCFAYCDGVLEEEVEERLEQLFGLNLLADFFQGGDSSREVLRLTPDEKKIVSFLGDQLLSLDKIADGVDGIKRSDIETVLDHLCEEGIVYKTDTYVGGLYAVYDEYVGQFEDENEDEDEYEGYNEEEYSNVISNVHFYMTNEVLSWLYNDYVKKPNGIPINEGESLIFDVYDAPFSSILQLDHDVLIQKIYKRNEFGINAGSPDLSARFSPGDVEGKYEAKWTMAGDLKGLSSHYMGAGIRMFRYYLDDDSIDDISVFDPNTEGVLVKIINDKPVFERVSGKKRPAMLCSTITGEMEMKRPYVDEAADMMSLEAMPFEERLEAANNGDIAAMGAVAEAFLNGDNVEQDAKSAAEWFEKQAELGDSTGQFNLGILYIKGEGVKQDIKTALKWMKEANENGDEDAVGLIDTLQAIVDLQEKSDKGNAEATAELAQQYMRLGSAFDEETEAKFYQDSIGLAQKAITDGCAAGYWIIGLAYEHGRGVEEDPQKAVETFWEGAGRGDAHCLGALGTLYIQGEIVQEDKRKGFDLCKKAAEKGNVAAMRTLGTCYQNGYGTEQSIVSAVEWYEKYMENGGDLKYARNIETLKNSPEYQNEINDKLSPEEKERIRKKKREFFQGKVFVLTGFAFTDTETMLTKEIQENGGIVKDSTVLDTNYLIYHDQEGVGTKKYDRALELNREKGKNIVMMSYSEFQSAVRDLAGSDGKRTEAQKPIIVDTQENDEESKRGQVKEQTRYQDDLKRRRQEADERAKARKQKENEILSDRVLEMIAQYDEPVNILTIAENLGISTMKLTPALQILKEKKLVEVKVDKRRTYYRLPSEETLARWKEDERKETFWKEHIKEREQLENELKELEKKIDILRGEVNGIENRNAEKLRRLRGERDELTFAEKDLERQQNLTEELARERDRCNIFQGKKKKEIQYRLDTQEYPRLEELKIQAKASREERNNEYNEKINQVKAEGDSKNAEIANLKKREEDIHRMIESATLQ